MFFLFNRKPKEKFNSALNLIYDNNIHALRNKVKILIVDDEDFEIINMLKERKYDIYLKKDITYAIEADPFDIVIIDINGIGQALGSSMGGFAVAEEIKSKYPAKQVWCYSASALTPSINEKLKALDGYILKDTDLDKWQEKLDNIITTYCDRGYQEQILREQLRKNGVEQSKIEDIIKEYKNGMETKNFNSFTEILTKAISSGKNVLVIIKLIYSYIELFAA